MGHEKIVMRYRKEIIEGKVIDLIPLGKRIYQRLSESAIRLRAGIFLIRARY